MDTDQDGVLTWEEIRCGMAQLDDVELRDSLLRLFEEADLDGSGTIDYTEFIAATLENKHCMTEATCWAAFRVFDRNCDGHISREELQYIVQQGKIPGVKIDTNDIVKQLDLNKDGVIEFGEFLHLLQRRPPRPCARWRR